MSRPSAHTPGFCSCHVMFPSKYGEMLFSRVDICGRSTCDPISCLVRSLPDKCRLHRPSHNWGRLFFVVCVFFRSSSELVVSGFVSSSISRGTNSYTWKQNKTKNAATWKTCMIRVRPVMHDPDDDHHHHLQARHLALVRSRPPPFLASSRGWQALSSPSTRRGCCLLLLLL